PPPFRTAPPPQTKTRKKKNRPPPRLSDLCPPYVTPSSSSSLEYHRSDARIVENGFAAGSGMSNSAKVGIEAVDDWRQHQQDEGPADCEHAPPLGNEGSAQAARRDGSCCRLRFRGCAGRACRDRAQAEEREQGGERGERCQHGEGPRGLIQRQ